MASEVLDQVRITQICVVARFELGLDVIRLQVRINSYATTVYVCVCLPIVPEYVSLTVH